MSGIYTNNPDLIVNRQIVSNHNPIPFEGIDRDFDAFSRVRTSEPLTLFEVQHQYNTQPLLWNDTTANGGQITHLPNESSVLMKVTTTDGSKSIRQTKEYFRYQPGKSQWIAMTSVMGLSKEGVVKRIGYYDDNNGMFFEQTQNDLKVVLRSSTSGSVVDTSITQSNWNLDKLDGSGNSRVTINMALAQIFVIDFQWLGVGRVRFGFNLNGKLIYVHEIISSNLTTSVYCTTANLPLRYEIVNIETTESDTSIKQICSMVASEGGYNRFGVPFSINNGVTGINVTTRRPIISIRHRSTFNSSTNTSTIIPIDISVFAQNNSALVELVYGGVLTSPSWSNINTNNSVTEYDVSASAISNGIIITSGYAVAAGSGVNKTSNTMLKGLISRLHLTNNESLTIVCTSINSTSICMGTIDWHELY